MFEKAGYFFKIAPTATSAVYGETQIPLVSFFARVWPLSSRKIQFRRTVESEVNSEKQATENPTMAHYIRFVRGFETRIRRTVITGEVKNSRMLPCRRKSVCTARKRQVPGTFN